MRGRRVEADVPHTPDPTLWADPLLLLTNAALFGIHRVIAPTSKVVFRELFRAPEEESKLRPRIYMTWHRMNYVSVLMFHALPQDSRPTIIAHDGIASRAFTHQSSEWLGYDVFVFHRRSPVSPRDQIARYITETGRPILNLTDSGGPYGVVKSGILEVARATNALIIPFCVSSTPSMTVGRKLRHMLPVPFARVDVRRGPALDGNATRDDCQAALDALA